MRRGVVVNVVFFAPSLKQLGRFDGVHLNVLSDKLNIGGFKHGPMKNCEFHLPSEIGPSFGPIIFVVGGIDGEFLHVSVSVDFGAGRSKRGEIRRTVLTIDPRALRACVAHRELLNAETTVAIIGDFVNFTDIAVAIGAGFGEFAGQSVGHDVRSPF